MRIDRPRFLSCVTESLSYARIQEVGAGHELGEQSKSCRIAALQFCDERRGRTSTGGGDQSLRVRPPNPGGTKAPDPDPRQPRPHRSQKETLRRRNQHVGELGEHGTFLGIETHTGTF